LSESNEVITYAATAKLITVVPFHFVVGYGNSRPLWDDALAIRDDSNVLVAANFEAVGLEGIGFSAARHNGVVGLHELLKPLTQINGLILPLPVVARCRRQRHRDKCEDVCLFEMPR
jgi:hypothetical protein